MINKKIKKLYKAAAKKIKNATNIAILTHVNPDIDALSSSFALKTGIENIWHKNVVVFNNNILPNSAHYIFDVNSISKETVQEGQFDLIISVDTPTIARLGDYGEAMLAAEQSIKFDHHINGDSFASINIVNTEFSSCAEIVFEFIKYINKKAITSQFATYAYAGLCTDTGSFQNLNTNAKSFEHALLLKVYGADLTLINESIFRKVNKNEVVVKKFLYNNFEIVDNKIAIIFVTSKDLEKMKATKNDCDNYSSSLICLEDAKVACSIIQVGEDVFRLSLRSKNGYPVSSYAKKLGGGGHLYAAGADLKCDITQAKEKAIKLLRQCVKENEQKMKEANNQ